MTSARAILCRVALPAAALLFAAPAGAQTRDHAPVSLKSATKMAQDSPGSESWTYAQPRERFARYRTLIVEPTVVYQGPDAQFEGVDPADRAKFAGIITSELQSELAKSFPRPAQAQADTMRLRVTLLGAKKTTGGTKK